MYRCKHDHEDWSRRNLRGQRTLCKNNSFIGVNFKGVTAGVSRRLTSFKLGVAGILAVSFAAVLQLIISLLSADIAKVAHFRLSIFIILTFFLLTQVSLSILDVSKLSLRLSVIFLNIFLVTLLLASIGIVSELGSLLGGAIFGFIILNILIVESLCFSLLLAVVLTLMSRANTTQHRLLCLLMMLLSTSSTVLLGFVLTQHGTVVSATIFSIILVCISNSISCYLGFKATQKNDASLAPFRRLAISVASYGATSFESSNLNSADFSDASLYNVDLRGTSMVQTRWQNAQGLEYAVRNGTYLKNPKILRLVTSLYAEGANLDGFNLSGLNLRGAVLDRASLVGTDLRRADLREASLTGACIENLQIDTETRLDGISCKYLYLTASRQKRFPQTGSFAPGECSLFLKIALNTVDVIFPDGIDWPTFHKAFQALRASYNSTDIAIQAIEKKRNGDFLIRLEIPIGFDLKQVKTDLRSQYEERIERLLSDNKQLKLLSAQYAERAEIYMQQNADFSTVIKQLAVARQMPTTIEGSDIEVNIVTGNQEHGKNMQVTQNFNADVNAVAANVEGNMNINAGFSKSDLVKSAQEIQALLNQLSETYNIVEVPKVAIEKLEKSPQMKTRLLGALQSGGKAALKEMVQHPAINILLASVEGWGKA